MLQVAVTSERVGVYSLSSAKKKVFISFNYDDDHLYRNFLSALKENKGNKIDFVDATPGEIKSKSVSRVKGVLTTKIRDSGYTLVLIGQHANEYHDDWRDIGERNWQWWEIKKAAEEGHKFIAVRLKSGNKTPDPLLGKGATWANSFTVDGIVKAINDA